MRAVLRPAGQVPREPGVNRAKQRIATFGKLRGAVDIFQQPLQLQRAEITCERKSALRAEAIQAPLALVFGDARLHAHILPDERVVQRFASTPVPQHRGLALVGDADRRQVGATMSGLAHRLFDDEHGVGPDLPGIMLDPARLGIDLPMFALRARDDLAAVIENHEARAGRALVDCADELAHWIFRRI